MSRVAEGTLQVTVKDSQLDAHITKLRAVKEAWQDMSQGAAALKNLVPAEVATELTALNNAVTGNTTQLKTFTGVMQSLGSTMAGLPKQLRDFAAAVDKIRYGASGAATGLKEVNKVLTNMSSLMSTSGIVKQVVEFSVGAGEAAKKARSMGRGFHVAADGLADLNDEFERTKQNGMNVNVGVPVEKTVTGIERATNKAKSRLKEMQQDFIRFGATTFIAFHWMKGALEALGEGAQKVDLENTLTLSLKNFEQTMVAAREATRGTVSELEMFKSAALMSSFGLPMEKFAEQMGMVQKMAIRTGQSTEYLMESLARGVSRLSPMILDNLGLQISLSKSYNTYAASLGKAASALTEAEKKQAVMNEVMRQSKELTKEVDVTFSRTARLDAIMAQMEDGLKDALGAFVVFLSDIFAKAEHSLAGLRNQMKLWKKELAETGESSVLASTRDLLVLADPGRLNGWQRFWTGLGEGVRDIVGLENARTLLQADQLENLQKQVDAQTKMLNTSRSIFNLIGEYETNFRYYDQRKTEDYQYLQTLRDINTEQSILLGEMENLGDAQDEETNALRENIRLRYEQLELEANYYDIRRQQQNLRMTLSRVADNQQALKDGEKQLELANNYATASHKILVLQEYNAMATAMMSHQSKELEDNILSIVAGLFDGKELLADEVQLQKTAYAVGLLKFHVNQAMNAQAIKALQKQEEEIVKGQLAAEGQLSIEYKHAEAQKRLNELQNEYNKLKQNSITLGTGETSATDEDIRRTGEEIKAQQAKVAALKEQAKYQKMGLDAAHDVTALSKKERDHLAFVLAGNMTRAQVEAKFLELRKTVLDYEKAVADLMHIQNTLRMAGMTGAAALVELELKGKTQMLEKAAEMAGKAHEDLKRFTMPSSGGGRSRAEKSTKERIEDMVYRIADSSFRQEKEMNEAGRTVSRVFFDGVRQEWTLRWDEEKKMWSSDLSRDFREILQGAYDTTAPMQWNALGTFTTRPREALDEIKRMTTDIQAFRDKMQQENALTFQEDAYLDTLLSRLEGERLVMEERISLLDQWSDHANSAAEAMRNAFSFAGDAQFFGREINNIIDNATETFERYAEVLKQSEYSTYDLFSASMPMMRATYQAFVKSKRQQAGIEMVMQAAAAWAAYPDVPKMVAHGTASLLYGAIAGGAIKLPSRTQSSAAKKEEAPVSKGPFHVHLYGDSIATEGERGRYLEQIMAEARAEGRI